MVGKVGNSAGLSFFTTKFVSVWFCCEHYSKLAEHGRIARNLMLAKLRFLVVLPKKPIIRNYAKEMREEKMRFLDLFIKEQKCSIII